VARAFANPEIIRWAVQRARTAEALEKKFPKLKSWINNESQPTFKQLEELAKATFTPLGYFFLSAPPKMYLSIPHYRTVDDKHDFEPSPELYETVQTMRRRQAWMREYLMDMGQEPLSFVGSCKLTENPREVARKMKRTLGMEAGWAADCKTWQEALRLLMAKVENAGILVVRNGIVGNNTRRKLSVEEFRGFVLVDEYAPLIFINGADGKAAQMFTIAHELAHIWYGESAAFNLSGLQPSDKEIERICNQAAAEFLVPEEELKSIWGSIQSDPEPFQRLAAHFKVSGIVTARRAMDLNLISRDEFFEFYREWTAMERRQAQDREGGGDFYVNQDYRIGRCFAEAVFYSAKSGRLTYNEAYKLTGLNAETFEKYAKHLGIEVYS